MPKDSAANASAENGEVRRRIHAARTAVDDIERSVSAVSKRLSEMESCAGEKLMLEVQSSVCCGCGRYDFCWEQNFKETRNALDEMYETLKKGGVIVYPTDTVYAMGCDALNVRAVEKICRMKGINPQKSNLSIICYDLSNISEYAKVSNAAFKLMKRHLPGPFTFILPTSSELPKIYKNRKEVGIRVPDNNIIRELVKQLGNPILTTSVHDDDDVIEYTTDPELIHEKYESEVDVVIDGGYGETVASTVVDCTTDAFEIIRQGKGELSL